MPPCATLEASYAYCRRLTRRRARNFYYAFVLLPRRKMDATCAVYAFMRVCDDLSDEPRQQGEPDPACAIARWRAALDSALAGDYGPHPAWPALVDTVRQYHIPPQYLHAMIDGVSSDLEGKRVQTFEELRRYCYQVASVVGLTAIHIFGFRSQEALPLAETCGLAFQLTNILRDIREDARRGRIYLPLEDLAKFGVAPEDLLSGRRSESFVRLMAFEANRARAYYEESMPLLDLVEPSSRPALWALIQLYRRLLERIVGSNYDVLDRRIGLPLWEKMGIALRALGERR